MLRIKTGQLAEHLGRIRKKLSETQLLQDYQERRERVYSALLRYLLISIV